MSNRFKLSLFATLAVMLFSINNGSAQDLSSGLIAWYPFAGNAHDSSGNQHNGTVNAAVLSKDRFGNTNSAYSFDGTKKGITIPAIGDYKATGVTISLWVKTTKKGVISQVVSGAMGTFFLNAYNLGTFLPTFCGTITDDDGTDASSAVVTTGQWVNLTATNNGTTTTIYVNGAFDNELPEPLLTGGSDLIIGNAGFTGSIDDIRIYNRVLTAQEVSAIYNLPQ